MQFQYDLDATGRPTANTPGADSDAPMYASVDGAVAALSGEEVMFQVRDSGASHVMTHHVLQTMDQCREFRPIEEHVARVQQAVPGLTDAGRIRQGLQGLAEKALLISDDQFIDSLQRPEREPAALAATCIRACDRPEQLARLLRSLLDGERRRDTRHKLLLIDDSRVQENIQRNRDLLRDFARESGAPVHYVGAEARQKLVGHATKAFPQHAATLAHLFQQDGMRRAGGGRSWNLALLLTAGSRLALLDEDFVLPLHRHELARDGADVDPRHVPMARFHEDLEEALAAGEAIDEDALEYHLAFAGQPLGAALSRPAARLQREALRGLSLTQLQHLRGDAPVLATLNGTRGSSGTETGLWLYQLPADSRADFWRSREAYLRNIDAGALWHGYLQPHPVEMAFFTPFVLDNSLLLPCTNPEGRGEDSVFSAMLRFCHPDALMLHLPTTIGHGQETARKRSQRTMAAHTPRFNHFLRDFLRRQMGVFLSTDAAQRMRLGADIVDDLAHAGERDRLNQLREYLNYVRADLVERLQQQLTGNPDAPIYWQADVKAIIEANARAMLAAEAPPRLDDWSQTIDVPGCAAALSEELGDMAAAWRLWPDVWAWARERGSSLIEAL